MTPPLSPSFDRRSYEEMFSPFTMEKSFPYGMDSGSPVRRRQPSTFAPQARLKEMKTEKYVEVTEEAVTEEEKSRAKDEVLTLLTKWTTLEPSTNMNMN